MEYREIMIKIMAGEMGIIERDIPKFKFEYHRDKQFSPFPMIDLGDYALNQ